MYITDYAMECCGLQTGQSFEGRQNEFDELARIAHINGRRAALVTLVKGTLQYELALINKFESVFEFVNPRTGNVCCVMAREYEEVV